MSDPGDLVSSSHNTLHRSTGEDIHFETGKRTKMKCGVTLAGIGHPFNWFIVEDWNGDICEGCFSDVTDDKTTDRSQGEGER